MPVEKKQFKGLSDEDKMRFANVLSRAENMGVLDINFSGGNSVGNLECYERALDIIEENKERFDRNAGECAV
jgi:hypothetical protein